MDEVEGTLLETKPVTYEILVVSQGDSTELHRLGQLGYHVVGNGGGSIILERASNNIPTE